MENKTAMQILIDTIKSTNPNPKGLNIVDKTQDAILKLATELLEVEKKNIVEAYNEGAIPEPYNKHFDGKDYYSTKFNNQK